MKKIVKMVTEKWNELSNVKKATIAFLFCSVFQKGIAIISTPIFTRLMTTEQYGEFSMYQTWLSFFSIITTLRLDYDIFNKGMTEYPDKRNDYLATMQTISTISTFVCFVLYVAFRNYIELMTGLPTIVLLAIFVELLFMPALSFWTLKERYEFVYKRLVAITIMLSFANIIIGVIAVLCAEQNQGIVRILTCVFVQVVFGMVMYYVNLRRAKKVFVREYAMFAIKFNIPLLPHYFSSYVLAFADRIMIQKIQSISAAGIYSVAYSIGIVMTMISSALNNALIPWQYRNLRNKDFDNINKRLRTMLVLLVLILIMFTAFVPEIMLIMVSREYYEAIYAIPPVVSSVFFIFLYNLVCNAEFFYNKNICTMILSFVSAMLNVVLNGIFINIFGFVAAGYTTLFCYVMVVFLHVLYANKVTKQAEGSTLYKMKYILGLTGFIICETVIMSLLYSYTLIRYSIIIVLIVILILNRNKVMSVILDRKH